MADFKDFSNVPINQDFLENIITANPFQDQMAHFQHEEDARLREIQRCSEEKEAEELRRHNEMIEALKTAGENGATIVIGDNANGIQIQQKSYGTSQSMTNSQAFNYEKASEVLKEIHDYIDFPQFQTTFKDNSNNVKEIIEETIKAVEERKEPNLIQKSLHVLKDLAIGAGGSLIASGMLALLATI